MDKSLKFSLIGGIIIISFSFAFYFVYFLPHKERNRQEIRSECAIWAKDKAVVALGNTGNYEQEDYDDYFERCLREKGI